MSKNTYLATIVFDPRGADGSADEMIPKLSEIIRDTEGDVTKVENVGTHDFAIPKKMIRGTCLQFEIAGSSNFPDSLKERLKLKKVDRVLIEKIKFRLNFYGIIK